MTVKRSTILSRRRALSGAAAVGIGVPLLAACGDDDTAATGTDPTESATSSSTPSSAPRTSGAAEPESSAASSAPAGEGIATSEVPVGGGLVLSDEQVVITQPTAGDFRAFTAVCTHAGCLVARVSTEIECDCHSSRFSIEDGSVVGGPAPSPLAEADFEVTGDRITLA
ncbi:Rieske (2Fe-2S) protein [Nocardioides pelophilus]|uniref:Rieske (2Fe-2S) protein n=1 Tax=Nocardioides pelophilus TaxID=2172019 RepID=UPI0015FFA603|nr:Rieske (2Fe-2S) protein [Nocardioides pelophilus]